MDSSLFSLEGKVAIVTGAGRGIGKSIALGLADAGADVVVCARTAADIVATAAEIRAKGRKSLPLPTDVRFAEQVASLVEKSVAEFGRIDILVNNAGGSFIAATMDLSEGGWDAIVRENLKSVFLCSKAAARVMIAQKSGNIVNIASIAGTASYTLCSPYGAAKAGLINFTATLAVELAPHNIRVNAIAPGSIATGGFLQLLNAEPGEVKPEEKGGLLPSIPLGRYGQPEDIVGAAVFLASDASSYVTGQTLVVDGGLTIKLA
jgi:NAD(P)-dependent dehydrogenase (short-subunit alcohol dehydrogenase family)